MKKNILLTGLAVGCATAALKFSADPVSHESQKVISPPSLAATQPQHPLDAVKREIPSADPLARVTRHLAIAEEQFLNAEQELEATGFPNVLLDERLSETERAAIVLKMQKANALQNQVAFLKMQKVDLEADRRL